MSNRSDPAAILARRGGMPLMRFRLAICPKPGVPAAAIVGGDEAPTPRQLKQRDTYQKAIVTADERAAQGYGRLGQKGPALTHVDFAVAHPKMKEKAEALKAAIEKLP